MNRVLGFLEKKFMRRYRCWNCVWEGLKREMCREPKSLTNSLWPTWLHNFRCPRCGVPILKEYLSQELFGREIRIRCVTRREH